MLAGANVHCPRNFAQNRPLSPLEQHFTACTLAQEVFCRQSLELTALKSTALALELINVSHRKQQENSGSPNIQTQGTRRTSAAGVRQTAWGYTLPFRYIQDTDLLN